MALTEQKLQERLQQSQLKFAGHNHQQHRIYTDAQEPTCPHGFKFTDSQPGHFLSAGYISNIKSTRAQIDACKQTGPCSQPPASLTVNKQTPSKREKHTAHQAKYAKAHKKK